MEIHDSDVSESGVRSTGNTGTPNLGTTSEGNRDRWKPDTEIKHPNSAPKSSSDDQKSADRPRPDQKSGNVEKGSSGSAMD